MKNKQQYQYPWRNNNRFNVLVDGAEYFPSMLEAIKNAQAQVFLESYLFTSGNIANDFISALCEAKKRGVDILILLDEYGSKGLNEEDKNKLIDSGIALKLYNPVTFLHLGRSLKRDHRKLLIVDKHVAYIGGAGVTDEFSPDATSHFWHDLMLEVRGEVIEDLTHSFLELFHEKHTPSGTTHIKNISTLKARVLISAGTEKNEIIRTTITHIRNSKKHVWLTSPYFVSSWKVRRALRFASKKGVDVRLLFPGRYSDHKWISYAIQRYYQRLLKANITIYEFQPRFTHAKIILCDDWYTLGSSNLDRWNQFLNLDANIEVYDEQSHQQIKTLFEKDFSKSIKISLEDWTSRSILQRIKETGVGIVVRYLSYISHKFKR
ncbi:MAG: phosphatidylserine/phosphatidylglycerophosphate/cardiolipin synthase family protein [Woeseiaceae bacterium]